MKSSRLLFVLAVAIAVQASAAPVAPVIPPARRTKALDTANELLATRAPELAQGKNPFYSEAFAAATGDVAAPANPAEANNTGRPAGPRGGRDLLIAIADGLRPSGYIVMGGTPSLSFGQKRVKAGGTLTITFEGVEHTVEIASIDRTHFTVRLGNETYTRPIK